MIANNGCRTPLSIVQAFDPAEFRQQGHQVIDLVADYLTAAKDGAISKVLPYLEPEDQYKKWQCSFDGENEAPLALLAEVIQSSTHLHHPHYVGHQNPGPLPLAALCDLVDGILNNPTAIYEMGPASSAIERQVIRWMAKHLGYGETADGFLTSGATLANLTALLTARQIKCGKDNPDSEKAPLAIIVSSQSHYSVSRASHVMGWGDEGIVSVPVDNHYKFYREDLETAYKTAVGRGLKIVAVVGNACSTATGTYDCLQVIAEFSARHDLWFHVDGAHGASALLSEKYRQRLNGIEQADSVVWDGHKMLMMPGLATGLVYKNGDYAYQTFFQKASYLFNKNACREWHNLGRRTFECSKKMIALKIYLALRIYGEKLFADYVNYTYDLAQEFADVLESSEDFELAVRPESNIICFRYVGSVRADLDSVQIRIREDIIQSGQFYFTQAQLHSGVFLRCVIMNAFTSIEDLKALLNAIRRHSGANPFEYTTVDGNSADL